eukprot:CFRG0054T1
MQPVTLTYWNGRGLCEKIRFMLAACQVPYEDFVPGTKDSKFLETREQFLHLQEQGYLSMGQVPLLCIDGLHLTQSKAIIRYLAKKHGMDGSPDPYQMAMCDIVSETLADYKSAAYSAWEYGLGVHPREEQIERVKAANSKYLPRIENQLRNNREKEGFQGGFLVGASMTYADVVAAEVLEDIVNAIPDTLASYPLTANLLKCTRAHPGIAQFLGDGGKRKMKNVTQADVDAYRVCVDRVLGR